MGNIPSIHFVDETVVAVHSEKYMKHMLDVFNTIN